MQNDEVTVLVNDRQTQKNPRLQFSNLGLYLF